MSFAYVWPRGLSWRRAQGGGATGAGSSDTEPATYDVPDRLPVLARRPRRRAAAVRDAPTGGANHAAGRPASWPFSGLLRPVAVGRPACLGLTLTTAGRSTDRGQAQPAGAYIDRRLVHAAPARGRMSRSRRMRAVASPAEIAGRVQGQGADCLLPRRQGRARARGGTTTIASALASFICSRQLARSSADGSALPSSVALRCRRLVASRPHL